MIAITFVRNESDYRAARFSWLLRHPWRAWKEFPDRLGYLGACLFLLVFDLLFVRPMDRRVAIGSASFGLLAVAAFYARFIWGCHTQFRREFTLQDVVTVSIDDRGIAFSDDKRNRPSLWVGFTRIYESRRVVVMEKGGDEFIYLPKNAMSEAQLDELRRLAVAATLDCQVKIGSPLGN